MKNRKAILIYGAESTGNRLLKRIFAHNGFLVSNDDKKPGNVSFIGPKIVHGHSLPANGNWYSPEEAWAEYLAHQYKVYTLILTRDQFATTNSQVRQKRVPDLHTAEVNYKMAYEWIFENIEDPYKIVTFETLIQYPEQVMNQIRQFVGENLVIPEKIKDANRKYYTS